AQDALPPKGMEGWGQPLQVDAGDAVQGGGCQAWGFGVRQGCPPRGELGHSAGQGAAEFGSGWAGHLWFKLVSTGCRQGANRLPVDPSC
ncbi:MAG: hypothetical protein KGZ91_06440, partial [Afipia sp.]|nr:hypothetical protein [Afipia sp.]